MFCNSILCRYHEIAIKGRNRSMFERCLVENLTRLLKNAGLEMRVKRVRGRVYVERFDRSAFSEAEVERSTEALKLACGLESFSFAVRLDPDMEKVKTCVRECVPELFSPLLAAHAPVSFRIRARRSDKSFPLRSKEIEIELATVIGEAIGEENLKVDLDRAELTIGCEVREDSALLFFGRISAPGGLPVGSNGGVTALLSGGIDSPVGCYLAMKRGCPVEFVSFHSAPYTPPDTTDKIRRIAKYLNRYQKGGRLMLCNLSEFQKRVRDNCLEKFRTILYRRAMVRIAARIARGHRRMALLTGESVGQVASQTLENMATIDNAAGMLVLRPLVGMDKIESIRIAEAIGTFELSNVQVPDSCTVFTPGNPATTSTVEQLETEEAKIADYDEIICGIADGCEVIHPEAL